MKILFEIVAAVRTPITLDESTRNKVFGNYALEKKLFQTLTNMNKRISFNENLYILLTFHLHICTSHSVFFLKVTIGITKTNKINYPLIV